MKISFHKFYLTPLRALNAKASLKTREGVFLKADDGKTLSCWEYFPHPELGDEDVDSFLEDFSSLRFLTQKKAFSRLKDPLDLKTPRLFLNHELFNKEILPSSKIIKYKLKGIDDLGLLPLLENGYFLRLDANGIFNEASWKFFEQMIPDKYHAQIQYVEDPLESLNWEQVSFPTARDFISGTPYKTKIYKPYREFFPQDIPEVIFSAPMGHILGTYLTYQELLNSGNLNLYHGIITPAIYESIPSIFKGNYQKGFYLNQQIVDSFFKQFSDLDWKYLCTI